MEIRRTPIFLSSNTLAIVHLFNREAHLQDIWTTDCDKFEEENYEAIESAPKQLISHLGGADHLTPRFLMGLRNEINQILDDHNKQFGTNF